MNIFFEVWNVHNLQISSVYNLNVLRHFGHWNGLEFTIPWNVTKCFLRLCCVNFSAQISHSNCFWSSWTLLENVWTSIFVEILVSVCSILTSLIDLSWRKKRFFLFFLFLSADTIGIFHSHSRNLSFVKSLTCSTIVLDRIVLNCTAGVRVFRMQI